MGALIRREMGLDQAEFLRSLEALLGGRHWRAEDDGLCIDWAGCPVRIRLHPTQQRRLGSLSLPMTRVEIDLDALTEVEAADFLTRFERAFQRGGG
ncbi:MAG: hypothetical protein D6720_00825 [Gammaproteobacteria bacterium]|nr:MAG: hypothetical protein D6720_00825 [Gammaproteobacteria bacterium]